MPDSDIQIESSSYTDLYRSLAVTDFAGIADKRFYVFKSRSPLLNDLALNKDQFRRAAMKTKELSRATNFMADVEKTLEDARWCTAMGFAPVYNGPRQNLRAIRLNYC